MSPDFAPQSAALETIGRQLTAVLPRGWTKSWLLVESEEEGGSVAVACYATKAGQGKAEFIDLPNAFKVSMFELRRNSSDAWTSLTYTLEPSGKFDAEYGYDPVGIEDEFERHMAWKARHLP